MRDDRFVVKRQQRFGLPHARAFTAREDDDGSSCEREMGDHNYIESGNRGIGESRKVVASQMLRFSASPFLRFIAVENIHPPGNASV